MSCSPALHSCSDSGGGTSTRDSPPQGHKRIRLWLVAPFVLSQCGAGQGRGAGAEDPRGLKKGSCSCAFSRDLTGGSLDLQVAGALECQASQRSRRRGGERWVLSTVLGFTTGLARTPVHSPRSSPGVRHGVPMEGQVESRKRHLLQSTGGIRSSSVSKPLMAVPFCRATKSCQFPPKAGPSSLYGWEESPVSCWLLSPGTGAPSPEGTKLLPEGTLVSLQKQHSHSTRVVLSHQSLSLAAGGCLAIWPGPPA